MSFKAKARALADDFYDEEGTPMQGTDTPAPGDPDQWARDNNGDLDWGYTARTIRKWSQDALLTHLWEKSFSIPPREYNPSAPFVWVQLASGDVVTLPHGYRLPLMFVAKYRWEVTLSKIMNERHWKQERFNMFHLSRLCENLFCRAQIKASRGGMEKGWRCVMFDRLLARFYKHWARNDPEGGRGFLAAHGVREYDRDVLKHDWKRWCLRGLNGVKMTEDEVTNGITIEQFRKSLKKGEDGVWTINGQPLTHITNKEPTSYSSSSELTDYSMDTEDELSYESEASHHVQAPPDDTSYSNGAKDGVSVRFTSPGSRYHQHHQKPPSNSDALKRTRDFPADDDENERINKRNRIESVLEHDAEYPQASPVYPLSRTLAAMARNPVWANTQSGSVAGSASTSQLPRESTSPFSNQVDFIHDDNTAEPIPPIASSSNVGRLQGPHHSLQEGDDGLASADVIPTLSSTAKKSGIAAQVPSTSGETAPLPPSSNHSILPSSSMTSLSSRPSRASTQKIKVKPAAKTSTRPTLPSSMPMPGGSQPRRQPAPQRSSSQWSRQSGTVRRPLQPMAPPPLSTPSSSMSTPVPANAAMTGAGFMDPPIPGLQAQANRSSIHLTALELLEKLIDVKRVLQQKFPCTCGHNGTKASVASDTGPSAQAQTEEQADVSTVPVSPQAAPDTVSPTITDSEKAEEEKAAIHAKLADFEEQFATIKKELTGIVERLQILEGATPSVITQAAVSVLAGIEGPTLGLGDADRMDMDMPLPPAEPPGDIGHQNAANGKTGEKEELVPPHQATTPASLPAPTLDGLSGTEKQAEVSPEILGTAGELAGTTTTANVVTGGIIGAEGKDGDAGDVIMTQTSAGDTVREKKTNESAVPVDSLPLKDTPSTSSNELMRTGDQSIQVPIPQEDVTRSVGLDSTQLNGQTTAEPYPTALTGSTNPSPQINVCTLDLESSAHKHASSEPDTDITMANSMVPTHSTSTLLNESPDSHVRDISSNLSVLVDNLVSEKLLSVMQGLVKTRVTDRETEKEKENTESTREGSISQGAADVERELEPPPAPQVLRADSATMTQSAESHTLTALLNEMRSIKQEAVIREQRNREEIEAIRELHSAEVDALRRRLSYLEQQSKQNRHTEPLSMGVATPPILQTPNGVSYGPSHMHLQSPSAPPPSHSYIADSYRGPHGMTAVPTGSQTQYAGGVHAAASESAKGSQTPVENSPEKEPPPPVRIYTDRNFGFTRPGIERDEEMPLPIKTQRKHHMAFARAQYG